MNAFKKPIHRDDLLPVIQSGIFIALISGLLTGAIKLMVEEAFGISLQLFFLVILAFYTARRIKNNYNTYHIIYSIITVVSFVLAFYLMNSTYLTGYFFMRGISVFQAEVLRIVFNPRFSFYFFDITSPDFFLLDNLLELIFFLIGCIYAYLKSK